MNNFKITAEIKLIIDPSEFAYQYLDIKTKIPARSMDEAISMANAQMKRIAESELTFPSCQDYQVRIREIVEVTNV